MTPSGGSWSKENASKDMFSKIILLAFRTTSAGVINLLSSSNVISQRLSKQVDPFEVYNRMETTKVSREYSGVFLAVETPHSILKY
jgi:hypothetical protein